MRWRGVCYRAHDPGWAWQPHSGAGAAANGGRFNAVGVPALYLALSIEGMILEMSHGLGRRFDPLIVCTYDVDMTGIVDLRTETTRARARVLLADLACPWALDMASGVRPASWIVAERLIAGGASGILVPSFARRARSDMVNIVLWKWDSKLPRKVAVHDPSGRLVRLRPTAFK